MPIPVRLPSALATQTGGVRRVDVEGGTVGAVLDHVVARFPSIGPRLRDAAGELYPFVTVFLNDQDIRFASGFDTVVRDGDEIVIVPAVAGG
jgi:molybdopterin converting factor small subunit